MSRTTQNVVLLLVGLSTAVMLVKGTYLNYVKPGLLWWLIAAAAVLVALGLVAIVRDLRQVNDDGGEGTHDEHRHRAGLGWLLLIPIAMVAFVVPPPKYAINELLSCPIGAQVTPSYLFLIERGAPKVVPCLAASTTAASTSGWAWPRISGPQDSTRST